MIRSAIVGFLALVERGLRFNLQVGSEVEVGVFDGSVHRAEESPTVLHQAMKMDLVQEITMGFTEIINVIPAQVGFPQLSGLLWARPLHYPTEILSCV